MAILTLTSNVPASVATPMRLIGETSSLVGQVAATVGYGFNGLGSTGHRFSSDGFRWGGENIIDRYGSPSGSGGSNIFSTDFDNGSSGNNTIPGSSATPLQFEATTAPGDSGGPILVQVGGEWVIAGVLSGGTTSTSVYGDISWWTGIANFQSAIEARGGVFVGSGAGSVEFDANTYRLDDSITVTVSEANAQPPISVTIVSDSGDSETFVLSGGGSTFTGNISVLGGAVSTNDGILQATVGDTITVTYVDPDDGSGSSSVETDTATILDVSSVLVGVDFDLSSGANPTNWLEVTTGSNTTFGDLNDEEGNPTAIDLTINETPNGNWTAFAATVNASTIPSHAVSLANLDGQIFNGADNFVLTYSDLDPLANYELYVFGLEGFFNSIQQRVTITGDGTPIIFDQIFNQNDLIINDQVGSSSQDLSSYAQVVTADSSGNIVINITPIGATQDVVLGGIAIAQVVPEVSFVLGDANDDGFFNNADISPFVLALTDPTAYAIANPGVDPAVVLDMNDDGVFDNSDISAFVAALTGGRNSGDGSDNGRSNNVGLAPSSLASISPTRPTLAPTRSVRSISLLPPIVANEIPTVSNENIARENFFASNHLFSVDQLVGAGERGFQPLAESAVEVGDRYSGTESSKVRLSKQVGVVTPVQPTALDADRQSNERIGDKAQLDRRDRAFTKFAANESGRMGKSIEIDLHSSLSRKI